MIPQVPDSEEIDRILRIPRRVWTPSQTLDLVRITTEAFRTPSGSQTLLPAQAIALAEISQWGGAVVGIPVGGGKTLMSVLAPRMLPHVKRPLLLLPAHLIEKTTNEIRAYREHWVLPPFLRTESYQTLSRVGSADFLDRYAPDLIIADEGHYLKNPSAGVTRRVGRYLKAHPSTHLVILTGTIFGTSLRDLAHLTSWALRHTNPLPENWDDLDAWARALDPDVTPMRRVGAGALRRLAAPGESVLSGFQRRLRETPGVVLSADPPLGIPLRVRTVTLPLCPSLVPAFETLRETGDTPDGEPTTDGVAVWRHARELGTGYFSVWDPRPPFDWAEARRKWARECRAVLGSNRRNLDTEDQLRRHLDECPGDYPEAAECLAAWREIEPSFTPNPVANWVSDSVVDWIVQWAREAPGLIWTDRPTLGERLADRGIPFYSNLGMDARTGQFIEAHDPARGSIVVGRRSNDSGRNLQFKWSRNLIVDVPPSGKDWEQLIGRTHRPGQAATIVTVDVLVGCLEDVKALWKAHGRSMRAQDLTGQVQKLQCADLSGALDLEAARALPGPQWKESKKTLTRE